MSEHAKDRERRIEQVRGFKREFRKAAYSTGLRTYDDIKFFLAAALSGEKDIVVGKMMIARCIGADGKIEGLIDKALHLALCELGNELDAEEHDE